MAPMEAQKKPLRSLGFPSYSEYLGLPQEDDGDDGYEARKLDQRGLNDFYDHDMI